MRAIESAVWSSPRQRLLASSALVLLVIVAISWFRREAPPAPGLVVGGPGRCVVDLVQAPRQAAGALGGSPFTLPGTPTRWLVVELRSGAAVAGWAASVDGTPSEVTVLAPAAVRVSAWPDREHPRRVGIEAWAGWSRSTGVVAATLDWER